MHLVDVMSRRRWAATHIVLAIDVAVLFSFGVVPMADARKPHNPAPSLLDPGFAAQFSRAYLELPTGEPTVDEGPVSPGPPLNCPVARRNALRLAELVRNSKPAKVERENRLATFWMFYKDKRKYSSFILTEGIDSRQKATGEHYVWVSMYSGRLTDEEFKDMNSIIEQTKCKAG